MYRYVTKGTFDAYNWELVERKQRFIAQVMTSKSPARSMEDVDATALSYAEIKALATGDERIREKMDLDVQVSKLKVLKASHDAQRYDMQDKALKYYPQKIKEAHLFIEALSADLPIVQAHPVKDDAFSMLVNGTAYTERKAAGEALLALCKTMTDPKQVLDAGEYRGFPMQLCVNGDEFQIKMKQGLTYTARLSSDPVGSISRINHALEGMAEKLDDYKGKLAMLQNEMKNAQAEAERPFPKEEELREKSARLAQLNRELENEGNKGGDSKESESNGPDVEAEEAPAREESGNPDMADSKPSIRQAIYSFNPPAPVRVGMQREAER